MFSGKLEWEVEMAGAYPFFVLLMSCLSSSSCSTQFPQAKQRYAASPDKRRPHKAQPVDTMSGCVAQNWKTHFLNNIFDVEMKCKSGLSLTRLEWSTDYCHVCIHQRDIWKRCLQFSLVFFFSFTGSHGRLFVNWQQIFASHLPGLTALLLANIKQRHEEVTKEKTHNLSLCLFDGRGQKGMKYWHVFDFFCEHPAWMDVHSIIIHLGYRLRLPKEI